MHFEPIYAQVFVRVAKPKRTEGGLELPDRVRDRKVNMEATKGLIMAAGPDCKQAEKEMLCLFPPGAGIKVVLSGEEFRFIQEGQLLALIHGDPGADETPN